MVALLEAAPEVALVGGNALRWYGWTHDPADVAMDYAPTIARFGLVSPALLPRRSWYTCCCKTPTPRRQHAQYSCAALG